MIGLYKIGVPSGNCSARSDFGFFWRDITQPRQSSAAQCWYYAPRAASGCVSLAGQGGAARSWATAGAAQARGTPAPWRNRPPRLAQWFELRRGRSRCSRALLNLPRRRHVRVAVVHCVCDIREVLGALKDALTGFDDLGVSGFLGVPLDVFRFGGEQALGC